MSKRKRKPPVKTAKTAHITKAMYKSTNTTPLINGLSYPRKGSHWKNIKQDTEVVILPGRYDGWCYFYVLEDPKPVKVPIDVFYKHHTLLRQALPDEDYMLPINEWRSNMELSEEKEEK